jgi:AraC-like DNA-binding protein
MIERSHGSPGVPLDKRVEKILEMMRADVRGELTLTEFAQSVNLSVWRLSHIFKSDVGMPPIKYLKLLRMERAKGLLESSFLSVKEIAFRVGLNDESHFVRDFKSTYGYSPTTYRAQFKLNAANGNGAGGNGNGNSNGNGATVELEPAKNQEQSKLRRQLALLAKQSILPSLHILIYMASSFDWSNFDWLS